MPTLRREEQGTHKLFVGHVKDLRWKKTWWCCVRPCKSNWYMHEAWKEVSRNNLQAWANWHTGRRQVRSSSEPMKNRYFFLKEGPAMRESLFEVLERGPCARPACLRRETDRGGRLRRFARVVGRG